jgi:hypothetical protein
MEPGVIVSKAFESPGEVMSRELPAGRAVQFMAKGDLSGCQVLGADFSGARLRWRARDSNWREVFASFRTERYQRLPIQQTRDPSPFLRKLWHRVFCPRKGTRRYGDGGDQCPLR